MAQHNDTGNLGETLAQQYLREQGYAIVKTNWRKGKHEVDIIAYKEGLYVFVEVKTRSNIDYGLPEDFVTKEKQRAYVQMANAYMVAQQCEEEVRFDIISVEIHGSSYHINHIENAFSAVGLFLR